jgi:uncharacterized protein (TIGR03435 family)
MLRLLIRPSVVAAFSLAWFSPIPSGAQVQPPDATLHFEVTSVKPNASDATDSSLNHQLPDRFTASNVPLGFLLLDAYEIKAHQLVGTPSWTWDKSYDVIGTFPVANPQLHEVHLMEQQMLIERFDLRLHSEERVIPAYDLVLARKDGRLGSKLYHSDMDCAAWAANGRPEVSDRSKSSVSPTGKRPVCNLLTTRTWLSGGTRTIQDLADSLQAMLGRPVLDKTGLTGKFDVDLQWSRTDLHADDNASSPSTDDPPIFTAVEEQLGLKLVPHKEAFNVLVLDHIQAPTPN